MDLFRFLELLAPGLRMIPELGVLVLEHWRIGVWSVGEWSIGVLENGVLKPEYVFSSFCNS
jgi:hypothetical protein